ncbi:MAG: NGG1p interacting factor NIF3 [Actinobacteria bacterium]|nr:MAG: NGG1p interacting factor NIF3 [Actinomycetota bacterium]
MKLKDIYWLAVEIGMEADPRGRESIEILLNKEKKEYEELPDEEKPFFDEESLKNPYADTRILWGDPETEIEGVLAGIDIEIGEILLADRLNEKGSSKINLLLAHHPEGRSLAQMHQVMYMQADIWKKFGVPINIGDFLIEKRAREVQQRLMPINHNRSVDGARLLGLNYMTVHTPGDNLVSRFVQRMMDEKEPKTVGDVLKELRKVEEYAQAAKQGFGPQILVGSPATRVGKIFVDMTGGTEGPKEVIEKLAQAGVGTLVQMHLSEKLKKEAEEAHINVVIAGHVSSDAIGLNLFLDKLEARGLKNIVPASGLIRVRRKSGIKE